MCLNIKIDRRRCLLQLTSYAAALQDSNVRNALRSILKCCLPYLAIWYMYVTTTVDWEYFSVIKVMWAKCSLSFNFVNLAGIWNLFNSGYFITQKFFHVTCTYIVIELAAYEMESSVRGYHVWDALIGENILMMKIDMLWLSSKITPLSAIFQERCLESKVEYVLCF